MYPTGESAAAMTNDSTLIMNPDTINIKSRIEELEQKRDAAIRMVRIINENIKALKKAAHET